MLPLCCVAREGKALKGTDARRNVNFNENPNIASKEVYFIWKQ